MTKIEKIQAQITEYVPFLQRPRFALWDGGRRISDDYSTLKDAVFDDAGLDFRVHPYHVRTVKVKGFKLVRYYRDSDGQAIILIPKKLQNKCILL